MFRFLSICAVFVVGFSSVSLAAARAPEPKTSVMSAAFQPYLLEFLPNSTELTMETIARKIPAGFIPPDDQTLQLLGMQLIETDIARASGLLVKVLLINQPDKTTIQFFMCPSGQCNPLANVEGQAFPAVVLHYPK